MDFIQDYVTYHSAYEIPRNYVYWSAFGLLGAIIHRKVYFQHGDISIPAGPVYILLVGPQGNKKSTPCSFAKKMYELVCPELEVGASTQSAEDIVKTMSAEGFAKAMTNENGESVLVSPYAFFINEFKDFIAYNPVRMLNFLGNIYDENPFRASTIVRGKENIFNPCLNILACENPDQLQKFMKSDIFTGGLSRRFILVYEIDYADPIPFIELSPSGPERQAWERVKGRLIEVRKLVGRFQWHTSGKTFYGPWYIRTQRSLRDISNPLMKGYISTKHIQLFKICMLLDAVSDKPSFLFTGELLELGLSFLDTIEKNMPKLSQASGRSEVLPAQQKVLDVLDTIAWAGHVGWMPEKELKKRVEGDFKNPFEMSTVFKYLEENQRIIRKEMKITNGAGIPIVRTMILSPEFYEKGLKDGTFKL